MNTPPLPSSLVSVAWLADHRDQVVLLDASLVPPGSSAAVPDAFIPGALRFDFDAVVCDRTSPLPHMMPRPADFAAAAQGLGIDADSLVIVADHIGLFASPRAWWMFRAMGHDRVAVLDGGLPAWVAAGLPTGPRGVAKRVGNFTARPRPGWFCDADTVARLLEDPDVAVVDARSAGRFAGTEAEPRPGLRRGHMPGAVNLPFGALQQGGQMRPVAELRTAFAAVVGERRRLCFSCGSGVTACVLALGADLAGYEELVVYDGSWAEWGLPSDRPVVAT